jgi:CRP-like cAMP-binding protein
MNTDGAEPAFRIWGADDVIHGPLDLLSLIQWVKARKVKPKTWIFVEPAEGWVRASDLPQLKLFLGSHPPATPAVLARAREMGVTPEALRRIKVLAQLDLNQLQRFLEFIEVLSAEISDVIVPRGSHGDAMYLILEGEVRASITTDGKEANLATLSSGDFFGEISLLDQGPRSADVIANEQTLLLRITMSSFERMRKEAPDVALPFLFNVSRSVVTRMRLLTRRYNDSLHFSDIFTGR